MENREKMLKEKLTHGKTKINKHQQNRQLKWLAVLLCIKGPPDRPRRQIIFYSVKIG
ncbi:hypothetical protein SAMN05518684_106114 [Salipaludibacillus aurantiacus]|uniref:Uncharacterized protein n=1 Tax=Salipaludibacillus aurantiacus TaxID=1601833 RepID=A0A1H9TUY9_9BACI|nr:hypothetical protein SAMN05518684_106114 [Salipaludibacillus aurantiacus]